MAHICECDHLSLIGYKIIEGTGSLPHFKMNLQWKCSVLPETPFKKEIHGHSEKILIIDVRRKETLGKKFPQKNVVCLLTPQRDCPPDPKTHKGDFF